jgi:hypothetical protein
MKLKNIFIGVVVIAQLGLAVSALAKMDNRMIDRYRTQLQDTTMEYVSVWMQNKPLEDYQQPLTEMLRQHSMLLSYGIDLKDDILVAHLFKENGKTVSLQVFAARIFFQKLEKQLGWNPDRTAPLKEKDYRIRRTDRKDPLAEDEFNLNLP